jgi:hypothetical protein
MLAAACGDDGLGEESAAAVEHVARCRRRRAALRCVGGACETLPHKWVTSVDIAPHVAGVRDANGVRRQTTCASDDRGG